MAAARVLAAEEGVCARAPAGANNALLRDGKLDGAEVERIGARATLIRPLSGRKKGNVLEAPMMDRFIARENIRHFRDMLLSDVDPEVRSRVRQLLVEEEDKLGKNLELLADIERHIAEGARRIEASSRA